MAGIGKVDATVTGNKRELQAAGNVTGDGVKYGENGALTVSSDFTAKVPELTVAEADVTANTHATFVTVAGQNINELDAKTTYHQKQLDFDATAKQPQRSLGAAGSLLLHPDHQEVHLKSLGLQTQGQTWQLAPGSQATINYAHDAVAVKNLTLVNGDQQIAADGTFGRPGDALKVTLTNVDLANVDALLLRPPQLTGRLNASGTVSGTKDAPQVKADFQVDQGRLPAIPLRLVRRHGELRRPGADARRQAAAEPDDLHHRERLRAGGALQGRRDRRRTRQGARRAGRAGDRIDLHIESTPIDLGLVQGFTTALTNVNGTLQAKIDITGSAADPHPNGVVTVEKAAFTVEPTGVAYSNLQGKIDLQPDKVHIDNISVLDNHQSALSITGDLAIHELRGRRRRAVRQRERFQGDRQQAGQRPGQQRPRDRRRAAGAAHRRRLGVETGQVNLDEILALTGDSAYATSRPSI